MYVYAVVGFFADFFQRLQPVTKRLNAQLGPLDHNEFRTRNHGIGPSHRRLADINPISAGSQPNVPPDESLVVGFGGEMHDYRELAVWITCCGATTRRSMHCEQPTMIGDDLIDEAILRPGLLGEGICVAPMQCVGVGQVNRAHPDFRKLCFASRRLGRLVCREQQVLA